MGIRARSKNSAYGGTSRSSSIRADIFGSQYIAGSLIASRTAYRLLISGILSLGMRGSLIVAKTPAGPIFAVVSAESSCRLIASSCIATESKSFDKGAFTKSGDIVVNSQIWNPNTKLLEDLNSRSLRSLRISGDTSIIASRTIFKAIPTNSGVVPNRPIEVKIA